MWSNSADSVGSVGRLALALAALLWLSVADASRAGSSEPAHGHEISRAQAAQAVQQRYAGAARVVRTDVINQAGHLVYVFRLLSVNGRVWVVRIDARNGAELP